MGNRSSGHLPSLGSAAKRANIGCGVAATSHVMDDQNEQNKQKLISLLKTKRALLIVGAGSSVFADYPTWKQLLSELAGQFHPNLELTDSKDKTVLADEIKAQAEKDNRRDEYRTFLVQKFKPKRITHACFHENLVRLGFCGIATFNYDPVLECAITACTKIRCETIDLCSTDTRCRVFDYLRALNPNECMSHVLHLHGFYKNPKEIILTRTEYKSAYGDIETRIAAASSPVANKQCSPAIAALGDEPLDTLHRKIIWSLLAMHPVLFVGFGVKDEFFLDTLRIVQRDFGLYQETAHFALMDYTDVSERDGTTDKDKKEEHLRRFGIGPIFYNAPAPEDHTGLQRVVSELARAVGVPADLSLEERNRRMWSLVNEHPTR